MSRRAWLRILEFVVAGIVLDLVETNIVFRLTTGRSFAWNELGLAVLVIVPFAVLTELVIDHPKFWHRVLRLKEE